MDFEEAVEVCSVADDECSAGCKFTMIGDGLCQLECLVHSCDYDIEDCFMCNSQCFMKMLGDGICDDDCNTSDCYYDGGDCKEPLSEECDLKYMCAPECDW